MKIAFMGSKAIGLSILRQLHEIAPGNLAGAILYDDTTDQRSTLHQLRVFCASAGIEHRVATGRQKARDQLRELSPDIAIASGWYSLFDGETIALPKYGILGIHNSLLPAYRGGAPLTWALMNGEHTVGATLFRMTEGMDDGPVLAKFAVEASVSDTIGDVLPRLEKEILSQMPSIWNSLINGSARWVEQDHGLATFCALRAPGDGLIDWSWPAGRVHNFVRAQSLPYPCAFTFDGDKEIRIMRTEPMSEKWFGTPGQVISAGEKPIVSCGNDTAIRLLEVLVDGNAVPASQVVKSIKTRLR
jgi:methionyl-tRNA formyltransferase